MKNTLVLLLVLLLNTGIRAEDYKKVKVYLNSKADIQLLINSGIEFDHPYFNQPDCSIEVFLDQGSFNKLERSGFKFRVLIDSWNSWFNSRRRLSDSDKRKIVSKITSDDNAAGFNYGAMAGFYTYNEVAAELDSMKIMFPDLVTVRASIGTTSEGRAIYMVKISDNPDIDEDEPEVLYTALHHAREPESMMQMIYFMYYILNNYKTDVSIKYLLNNRQLYFIPVVNPDGYEYNRLTNPNGGGLWRKNRRGPGTDLNRNYGPYYFWNSSNGGSSKNPESELYRGEEPFSEPETAALRDFLASHKIKTALNFHSYGNMVIYPYAAVDSETPDSLIFRQFASDMSQINNYKYGTSMETVGYPVRGSSDDYFYDGDSSLNRGKIISMTVEAGKGTDEFWPEEYRIIQIARENVKLNLYSAWAAGEYIVAQPYLTGLENFHPGEVISFTPMFVDKGIIPAKDVRAELTSLDGLSTILAADIPDENSPVRTTSRMEVPFTFRVSEQASGLPYVKMLLTVSVRGEIASIDTILFNLDNIVLPVEIYSFTADKTGEEILVKWITATETNTLGFEIERSSGDTEHFIRIGSLKAAGTSSVNRIYNFKDLYSAKGKVYYRIKTVNMDGTFTYTNSREVDNTGAFAFLLEQNYPNPFNSATNFIFSVAQPGVVSIKIYNILGGETATVINEVYQPGSYNVEYNTGTLPSGVYYYTMSSGSFTSTKKMLILK